MTWNSNSLCLVESKSWVYYAAICSVRIVDENRTPEIGVKKWHFHFLAKESVPSRPISKKHFLFPEEQIFPKILFGFDLIDKK